MFGNPLRFAPSEDTGVLNPGRPLSDYHYYSLIGTTKPLPGAALELSTRLPDVPALTFLAAYYRRLKGTVLACGVIGTRMAGLSGS